MECDIRDCEDEVEITYGNWKFCRGHFEKLKCLKQVLNEGTKKE